MHDSTRERHRPSGPVTWRALPFRALDAYLGLAGPVAAATRS